MQTDKIIQSLIDNQIVSINLKKPFRYASGILSPIYTDFRLTISIPELRDMIADGLAELIREKYPDVTVIGGVATAGIPHAAWVAERLNLPLIYVRAKPKDHGAGKQIEGRIQPTDKVVLIDDLISTGGSVLGAVKAVRNEGVNVIGVASVFTYGMPDADKNFAAAETTLYPLLSYAELISQGHAEAKFSDEEYQRLSAWHQDPWAWTKREEANVTK